MPELPEDAVLAAARVLGNDCHGGPPDGTDIELARDALDAAWPYLAGAVAGAILAHMEAHAPPPEAPGVTRHEALRRAWHRHFGIAARVAASAFLTEDELKRQAAEAIKRGDYVACNLPEDRPDHGTAEYTP